MLFPASVIYLVILMVAMAVYGRILTRRVIEREDKILRGVETLIDTLNLQREDQSAMMLMAEMLRTNKDRIEFRREPPYPN